ncbi:hypothetical protein VQL36_03335 [Chengkuizengella sp. SCS-71B]|uniref:hypothetical protein n=1 Tax=Chengkuizengella sp. SCS-71B TaxID=3115290 RepID=UPI0032C21589
MRRTLVVFLTMILFMSTFSSIVFAAEPRSVHSCGEVSVTYTKNYDRHVYQLDPCDGEGCREK